MISINKHELNWNRVRFAVFPNHSRFKRKKKSAEQTPHSYRDRNRLFLKHRASSDENNSHCRIENKTKSDSTSLLRVNAGRREIINRMYIWWVNRLEKKKVDQFSKTPPAPNDASVQIPGTQPLRNNTLSLCERWPAMEEILGKEKKLNKTLIMMNIAIYPYYVLR